ncbi:MAG: DNA adenine methylase [Salinarimonadaceae bacterium]|nr:MAG: DNA adenine methylase [Salinarimonadaceae bacterium]
MPRATSPLRYPGGKTCLYPLVSSILRLNNLELRPYAEPFAGGCGLALALLYGGHVSDIHINDVDLSIWSFWHCVLNRTDELVYLIEKTPITVDEWRKQREIYLLQDQEDIMSLGFSTFFLNRTNRSGIIKDAGVIGGLSQKGNYKINCRFNRSDLIRRIRRIAKYKKNIHLYRKDALFFMQEIENLSVMPFICIDPPYFQKGSSLYTSFYKPGDHEIISNIILNLSCPWIVTYDNAPTIAKLYEKMRLFQFDINYSLETKRIGTELLIPSNGLTLPADLRDRQVSHALHQAA